MTVSTANWLVQHPVEAVHCTHMTQTRNHVNHVTRYQMVPDLLAYDKVTTLLKPNLAWARQVLTHTRSNPSAASPGGPRWS